MKNESEKNIEGKSFEKIEIPVAFPQPSIYDPSKVQIPPDVEDHEKGIGIVTGVMSEYKSEEDIFGSFDIEFIVSNPLVNKATRFHLNSDLFDDYLFGIIIEKGMFKILGESDKKVIVFYELVDDCKEVRYIISPRYFNEVLLEDYEISDLSLEKIDEILNIIVRAREFSAYADDEDFLKSL